MNEVKCETCGKVVKKKRAWTLCGRDYEDPSYFCTDGCRTMFPRKKTNKEAE